jgi:hypothetical protein
LGIFYSHLVYFPPSWCIFTLFGILYPEKSGNPEPKPNEILWKLSKQFAALSFCRKAG